MRGILVFDFLSHEKMHHPFNEAYLRMLCAAFPHDAVAFHARAGHTAALSSRFTAADQVQFHSIQPFTVPFGFSPHNPLAGRIAAWRCWRSMREAMSGPNPRLVSVLGFDANLLSVLRRAWARRSDAVLHLVLHNHLAGAARWRSRNPLIRSFDLVSGLRQALPPKVRLIALELGIREAATRLIPEIAGSIDTLEHPVLRSEWATASPPSRDDSMLRIAFLGHASLDKGFGHFASWARDGLRADLEFHAIGLASNEKIDFRGLARAPSPHSLGREEYMAALQGCDIVCLPLSPLYDYVASGSVIDAISGLKPIFSIRNGSLAAMEAKYGPFGYLAENVEDLRTAILGLDRNALKTQWSTWIDALDRMRAARLPEALAADYRGAVSGSEDL